MMNILKIKEWKDSRKPAFKIVNDPPSGQTLAKRLKDGKLFERMYFYYTYTDGLFYDIMSFKRDMKRVHIRIYKKVGNEHKYIVEKVVHIDEL